ncbi:hypothetical protein PN497_11870 [Sphaerospermopsis kisseleviana CS-549]|uniref:Uncharacterized protein n=2 Tax=Sphaerospermopsis TaxID=752201 RepID=A0A479ZUA4_9CYAN|nr:MULTISPECIES: hypothetical protein [Sphaerospermopsis]MBD2135219.1 hypothetical protein [Sphaerospermopsis sp. FACHB-1094]MDB9442052.1 hypothetical protein [Sphaerospermopsis kisseleviana CS-549]BAZ83810.1 hypothetical protein NIES73_50990 [Sphaerospermopsis kisseleviana NIES-73]GCL35752.1 hypothetical protein SR1949_08500 [Sphaerospermopsis reniformis]
MTRIEILVDALKKAIARGTKASHIAQQSGVNAAVISRLISGKQHDIMTEFYFDILDCLDEDIRKEAMTKLGIKTEVKPEEMVKYLKGRQIAQLIPLLNGDDRADIAEAIALSMRSNSKNIYV